MRLFAALDIDPEIRKRITEFRNQMKALAPAVRWVGPETFHVTLQFLGETTKSEQIRSALEQVRSSTIPLTFRDAGFFPNPKAPRVFWVGIESDPAPARFGELDCKRTGAARIRARNWTIPAARDSGTLGKRQAASGSGRASSLWIAARASQTRKPAAAGVRYNDGARVLSLRKPDNARRSEIYEALALRAGGF